MLLRYSLGSFNPTSFVYWLMKALFYIKAKDGVYFYFLQATSDKILLFMITFWKKERLRRLKKWVNSLQKVVSVFLIAKQSNNEEIIAFEKNFVKDLNSSYVLLTLFKQKKLIFMLEGFWNNFDKEAILFLEESLRLS